MEQVWRRPSAPLAGGVAVPGDKSLSHRAVLLSAMAEGTSSVSGVLDSEDVRATVAAVSMLGAEVEVESRGGALAGEITGWGRSGPVAPEGPIDCGNSGTTARLLLGVLAGWPVSATLIGDASLSRRPMERVTRPLIEMGASFESESGTLPVTVRGGDLTALEYESPVASAQVKSAILLAGLRGAGRTVVQEPAPSRDHTERLLPAFGVPVGRNIPACTAWVDGPAQPLATRLAVPGDPSSAAFIVAAGLLVPGSRVVVTGVGLNPTRIAFLDVLERMGADVRLEPSAFEGAEPVGAVHVNQGARLEATTVTPREVPALVDEVPVLALVATQASGTTRFEGVGELRVKESDRLAAILDGINALGGAAHVEGDTLLVQGGPRLRGATLPSLGDHRLAMVWALAGLASSTPVVVTGFEAVDVSYPGFARDLESLGATG